MLAALDVAREITRQPTRSTRSASASAARCSRARSRCCARAGEPRVASLTLLTTMLDFTDPGEIGVYIDESFVAKREPALCAGRRRARQRARAAPSRACARTISSGSTSSTTTSRARRRPRSTCSTGTATATNLPGPMYAYYLRNMYLDNKLREPDALTMCGEPVDLARVDAAGLRVRLARGPHRAVEERRTRATRLLRRRHRVRARRERAHRRRRQPASTNRRNYWVERRSCPTMPDAWLARRAKSHPGAGGRTGARGSRRTAGTRVAAPATPGSAAHPRDRARARAATSKEALRHDRADATVRGAPTRQRSTHGGERTWP